MRTDEQASDPGEARPALRGGDRCCSCVGWFAVIAPKRSDAAKLKTEIDGRPLRDRVAQAAIRSPSRTPSIRVADLFKLSRAMPNSVDIPGVLLQLSDVAEETGVSFQSITPHDPVSLGTYQQIGIDLVFEGRFYDLSDFLYRLRNLVAVHDGVLNATGRLFSVDSIAFDAGEPALPAGEGHADRFRLHLRRRTTAPPRSPAAATASTSACERGLAADPGRAVRRDGRRSMSTAAAAAARQEARPASEDLPRRRHRLPARRPRLRAAEDARPARQPVVGGGAVTTASPIAAVASPRRRGRRSCRDTDRFVGPARHGPAALVRPVQEQGPVRAAAVDHGRADCGRALGARRRPCPLRRRRRRRA